MSTLTTPQITRPADSATAEARPVAVRERIATIDVLRGFALLGILLVNMAAFSHPIQLEALPGEGINALNTAAAWFIRFAAEAKFYSLFSFLFGLGFTIQMTRAAERSVADTDFRRLYTRRLLWLLLFGIIHGYLIWVGDILFLYALLGFLLLTMRDATPPQLLRRAALLLGAFVVLIWLSVLPVELARLAPPDSGAAAEMEESFAQQAAVLEAQIERAYEVYSRGNFFEITAQRASDMLFMYTALLFAVFTVFPMFLVGAWFGKRRIFYNVEQHLPLFRRLLLWGGLLGLTLNALFASLGALLAPGELSWRFAAAISAQTIGAPALMLFYMAALTLALRQPWGRWLGLLAPLGRMALTNYIAQSLLCTLIFYGYGLAFFGRINSAAGLALALLIWLAQIPLSALWLRYFRFGPLEWLWRSLTYGEAQPMRRVAPDVLAE